jgi:hypothetical protein
MRSAHNKGSENGDGREEQQEQSAGRKTMAAEWGELLPLRCHFYFIFGNSQLILDVHTSGKRLIDRYFISGAYFSICSTSIY